MTPRAQHPRAAWPSNDDMTVLHLGVILLGAGIGAYVLWTNYHSEISAGLMWWRHREILLLRHVTSRFDVADAQMRASDPAGVTLRDLYGISHAIGQAWRIPGALFVAILAALCLVRNAASRFKRQFDLSGLMTEQIASYPTAAAFAQRQLRLIAPANEGPHPADYALSTQEWMARHATAEGGSLDARDARAALLPQLGPRWRRPEAATPQVRVLFVAFALHLAERRDEALALLGACSLAFADVDRGQANGPEKSLILPASLLTQVDQMLADRAGLVNAALDVTDRHAWTHPALMSLLNAARSRAGVLAPAQFAWLRLVDRHLWYALHALGFESEGVGRYLHPNPRVEAVGVRDHWAHERAAGRPLAVPRFERALEALARVQAGGTD